MTAMAHEALRAREPADALNVRALGNVIYHCRLQPDLAPAGALGEMGPRARTALVVLEALTQLELGRVDGFAKTLDLGEGYMGLNPI